MKTSKNLIKSKQSPNNKKLSTYIAILTACLLWGSAFPVLKTTYRLLSISDTGSKIQLAGARFSLAGLLILVYFYFTQKSSGVTNQKNNQQQNTKVNWLPNSFREGVSYFILGLFQTGIMYLFFYIGLSNTTGIKTAILSQIGTFFVVIMSHYAFEDDNFSKQKLVGLFIGFLGIVVINLKSSGSHFFDVHWLGEGFLIIAGLFGATGTIYGKKLTQRYQAVKLTGWQMFFGGMTLLLTSLLIKGGWVLVLNGQVMVLFVYSVILSAIAFTLWYRLLQRYKAGYITVYRFMIPVFGTVLSAIFIPGEELNLYLLAGLVLVAIGIYECNRKVGEENV